MIWYIAIAVGSGIVGFLLGFMLGFSQGKLKILEGEA